MSGGVSLHSTIPFSNVLLLKIALFPFLIICWQNREIQLIFVPCILSPHWAQFFLKPLFDAVGCLTQTDMLAESTDRFTSFHFQRLLFLSELARTSGKYLAGEVRARVLAALLPVGMPRVSLWRPQCQLWLCHRCPSLEASLILVSWKVLSRMGVECYQTLVPHILRGHCFLLLVC